MNITPRTKILLVVLVVVALGAALYYYIALTTPESTLPTFPFAPHATTTSVTKVTTPSKPTTPGTTTTRPSSGYAVTVHGTTETIASPVTGVTLDTSINSTVSQDHSVLMVTPAESKNGESLTFEKTDGGFADALTQVQIALNGKQVGFDALRTTQDSSEFNPGHVVNPAHIIKLKSLTVGGIAAVEVHITATTPAMRDFYVTWVRSGTTNWYIVRTNAGKTPEAATELDLVMSTVKLVP